MQSCSELPELTLNLSANHDDVFKLLEVIKPAWKRDKVNIKVLSGGYSCHMLRCSEESGESVTVRVRDKLDGLRDPVHERQIVKIMSSHGYFPPVLAVFGNGFCYEYIQGRPIFTKDAPETKVDDKQLRKIAQEMANIHSVDVAVSEDNQTSFFDFVVGLLDGAKPCCEGCASVEELVKEVRLVQDFVSVVKSPIVQIHGDPHIANIVWNEEQGKVTFVDWEISQVASRAYDVVYFLNSFHITDHIMKVSVSKPTNIDRKFCMHYLEQWNNLHKKSSPTEEEIKQLLEEVKYFKLVANVVWLVYVVKFADIMSVFGSIESLWQFYFNRYIETKEELLGIKTLGLPAKEVKLTH